MMKDTEGKDVPKPPSLWTYTEKKDLLSNGQAVNALFAAIDEDNFKLITNCTTAKAAWDILHTAHEGTPKVKISMMQMITSIFEAIRMKEDETIAEFNGRVKDITNESASLGEVMSDKKLVRKTLRSLTPRFDMKVTVIEETNDVTKMPLEELVGSLKIYEMSY